MINLRINGEERSVPDGHRLSDLLSDIGLDGDDAPVAVALNLQVVPKSEQASTPLNEGDRVDVVTAVGGG